MTSTALTTALRFLVLAAGLAAAAQATAQTQAASKGRNAFGDLGSNKEPIKIDADRLDVFDKESRAVFAGNVVAVQGDSTMKCTTLTVFYESRRGEGDKSASATASSADSQIKKIDCKGPVTIVSKDQVATGNNATFDRVVNRVELIGNVALSQGPNVTRGERMVYDLNTGVANVINNGPNGRVQALFVPGSGPAEPGGDANKKPKAASAPTN